MHALFGLDLLDFFRGKYSWRKLANLIQKLPSQSRTLAARVNDDELAEQMLDAYEDAPDMGPAFEDYSPVVERLDVLSDRLQSLEGTLIAVNGGKPPRMKPARRPTTALQRAQGRVTRRRHDSLVDEVMQAQERAAQRRNTIL